MKMYRWIFDHPVLALLLNYLPVILIGSVTHTANHIAWTAQVGLGTGLIMAAAFIVTVREMGGLNLLPTDLT